MKKVAKVLSYKFWGGIGAIAAAIGVFFSMNSGSENIDINLRNNGNSTVIAGSSSYAQGESNIIQGTTGNITIFQNDFKIGLSSQLTDDSGQRKLLAEKIIA